MFKELFKEMTVSGDIATVHTRIGGDPKEAKKKIKKSIGERKNKSDSKDTDEKYKG